MTDSDSALTSFIPNEGWLTSIGAWPAGSGHWFMWAEDGNLLWQDPNCRGMAVVDVTSGTKHLLSKAGKGSPPPLIKVEGSLLCTRCGAHGWLTDGRWVAA